MVSSPTSAASHNRLPSWGGFLRALSALAVACRHAAYALYNSRGHCACRIRCAWKCFAAAQQNLKGVSGFARLRQGLAFPSVEAASA